MRNMRQEWLKWPAFERLIRKVLALFFPQSPWYREGINPQTRLPYLAAYLGHRAISSTLVYLTITQELLLARSLRRSGRTTGAASPA